MKIVDARGLDCPQPVILTKRAMDEGRIGEITTIVDNATALENVKKLAASQGYNVKLEEKAGEYSIHLSKSEEQEKLVAVNGDDVAVLITSSLFGQGEEELGQVLMKGFLYALNEVEAQIKHMIFMNSGVTLTTEGSPVLEHLSALEEKGVEIMSCGTCLDFYGLKDKLAVGRVTNMYTAMETLLSAKKTLKI